jgi:DNA-binding transcriptional ArsR family regulator
MIDSLITSKTKIKLLLKFFLNPENSGYLRQLSAEFDESSNGVRVELNKLEDAKVITSEKLGRNKVYKANKKHPLFADIRNIILKSSGIQSVIDNILQNLGRLEAAYITGDYAKGVDSGVIDLIVVGEEINQAELDRVSTKTEKLIERKIRVLKLSTAEFAKLQTKFEADGLLHLFGEI